MIHDGDPNYLFYPQPVAKFLADRLSAASDAIVFLPREEIEGRPTEEHVRTLTARNRVEELRLDEMKITFEREQVAVTGRDNVSRAVNVVRFVVPWSGRSDLWGCSPGGPGAIGPKGIVDDSARLLTLRYEAAQADPKHFRELFDRDMVKIRAAVATINEAVRKYNDSLPEQIAAKFRERLDLLKDIDWEQGIGFPTRKP